MHVIRDRQPAVVVRNALMRILPVLGCLLLAAGPSAAATYYVSTAGNDANVGTQSLPWRTLAKANATLVAGDACWIAAGTYADPIQPVNSGTGYRPGGMISYVGSIANPGGVVVPSLVLRGQYVSVKGVTVTMPSTSHLGAILSGTRDSLSFCTLNNEWVQIDGGSDNLMANCTINAGHFFFDGLGTADTTPFVVRDTIRNCTFNLNPTDPAHTSNITMSWTGVKSCLIDSSRFNITAGTAVPGGGFTKLFYSQRNRIADCKWTMTLNTTGSCDECWSFRIRDISRFNVFERDTFYMDGAGGALHVGFYAACTGAVGNNLANTNNKFDHCLWKIPVQTQIGGAVVFQAPGTADTLDHCTIISGVDPAIAFKGDAATVNPNSLVIDHCTFVSFGPEGRVFDNSDGSGVAPGGANAFTNSIFYAAAAAPTRAPYWLRYPTGVASDRNLFYSQGGSGRVLDLGFADYHSLTQACTDHGYDCNSVFGNPAFAVSSSVAAFDPRLLSGSAAIGRGAGGSDIGAFPFVPGGADLTPPATVTNLAVVQVGVDYALLGWTAPGDNGTTGTVAAYDLRTSTQPITAANFAAATAVAVAPAILPAGSAQSYAATGLTASTPYYFALKARDAAGNWSTVSNVPTTTTTATDQVPPARITDLH